MDGAQHIVCPHCDATNRVLLSKLDARPVCGRCRGRIFDGRPVPLDGRRFQIHLSQNGIPLVVDFWAPWCGPCRSMAPLFEEAARRLEPRIRLAKVNTEEEPEVASRLDILSIPTLVLFSSGREVDRQVGALGLDALTQWIRSHVL